MPKPQLTVIRWKTKRDLITYERWTNNPPPANDIGEEKPL